MTDAQNDYRTGHLKASAALDYQNGPGLTKGFGRTIFNYEPEAQPPRLFLLDDDAVFCKLMEKIARKNGIPLTACTSLDRLGTEPSHRDYDVAIVDYYLEDMRGPQIAPLLGEHPIVLVSRSANCVEEEPYWPDEGKRFIKTFIAKQWGPLAILEAAMTLGRPETPPSGSGKRARHLRAVR